MRPGRPTPRDPAMVKLCTVLAFVFATAALTCACVAREAEAPVEYDPLAHAMKYQEVTNPEATVPSMCYTRTDGVSNPCWTCHTDSISPNEQADWELQQQYAFSNFALTNRWTNLFEDRRVRTRAISDAEALAWIRQDNYRPLADALRHRDDYNGFRPDLDFSRGFDADGFARDGSRWRALRFKPFPGTFWPTNGATDDVFVRLPYSFHRDAAGRDCRETARVNFAILEAALCGNPAIPLHQNMRLQTEVEPVDESVAAFDLDGDGTVGGKVAAIHGLPPTFAGGAADVAVERYKYPVGTEFLHTVRYIDPDQPNMISVRMKELRYSRKVRHLDGWGTQRAYERELNEKLEGVLPFFAGGPEVGLVNAFGWQLQGFIEDARGRLRLQTRQEHYSCMGCHSAIGVTVDQTFSFARKLPGRAGWAYQDLRGMHDAPQAGHAQPEVLTYLSRVQGGDEFRANDEMLQRFFPGGTLDEPAVRRAALGGDKDLHWLLAPSRRRALDLNKAYMVLVQDQGFERGRDPLPAPPRNVHASIENGETGLGAAGKVFRDGRLWLDWAR